MSSLKPANNAFTAWDKTGSENNGFKIIQEEGLAPFGIDEPSFRDVLVGFVEPQEAHGTFP